MEKILISNIGNRNITFKGEILNNVTFRKETERIWNDFPQEKEHLFIQIIPNHINADTQKIILISTNQDNPAYNNQDTIYEGKILKVLLEEQFKIPVVIETFKGNPTNENEIFPFYADFFRKIIFDTNKTQLIFNDAGGTPQMKLVVKELLGYYLPPDRYKIVYSDQKDIKRKVERIYKNKYVLLKTAQQFVKEYNYSAALRVLQQIPYEAGVTSNLVKLITIASKRLNFETKEVMKMIKDDAEFQKSFKSIFSHFNHKTPPGDAIPFQQFKRDFTLSIFELASICQLYFNTGNYTLGVATYYRLAEEIFHKFAHSFGKYKLSNLKERERFLDENLEALQEAFTEFYSKQEIRANYGLPVLALYSWLHGDAEVKNVSRLFMKTISLFRENPSKGIDLLRNQCFLAHKNNAVNEDMVNKTEPLFLNEILPDIFKCLNMPEENIYDVMNRLINKEFMNN